MHYRITQHKIKKDGKRSDADRELRAENQRLRKEVKSLKRDISRLRKQLDRQPIYDDTDEQEEKVIEIKVNKPSCPECDSTDLGEVKIGIKILTICKNCKYRKMK